MLDKILGKKDKDKNDTPDLRKNGKKSDSDNSDIGGRLKDMVGKVSGKPKDDGKSKKDEGDKKASPDKKIPRPMPKPKPKQPIDKPRLRPPEKKKPGGIAGLGGGLGKQIPDDDKRTLVGAAVFGIVLIILVGAGYYFLVYAPYQDTLNSAKMAKINEVNSYFKGALATDPRKNMLLADIDSGTTPDQVLAVDVIGPATTSWRTYQNQQINLKKDPYGRVQISYSTQPSNGTNDTSSPITSASDVKNLIVKVADAQKIVNEADASVLANMQIVTPDTVAVPIVILRTQAAGGLINVGDAVDVYQNVAPVAATGNNTTTTTQTATNTSPIISGATVLAILRNSTSGIYGQSSANLTHSQSFTINSAGLTTQTAQSAQGDVEQLLRAGASRNWNDAELNTLLNAYGWRLSDFERVSNLGELDAQYLILLEVPRENALWLIQNSNSVVLTVPTQRAPEWMISELHQIYG
jgi:hypothetical protein